MISYEEFGKLRLSIYLDEEVDDFEFTMAGNWVLVVSGTTSAGDPLRKQVDIGAVRIGSPSVDQPLIPSERCYSTPTPTVQD